MLLGCHIIKRSPFNDRDWEDQWLRAQRWHGRLVKEVQREAILGGKDAGLDYVYAFFMNCYHVQDWVLRSGYRSKVELVEFFRRNVEMDLCRSICHSAKHFERNTGTVTSTATQQPIYSSGYPTGRRVQPIWGEHWMIVDDKHREHDMFELADRCMSLWMEFLRPR